MQKFNHPTAQPEPGPSLADVQAEFPDVTFEIAESGHCLARYPGIEHPLRDRNLTELRAQLRLMRGISSF